MYRHKYIICISTSTMTYHAPRHGPIQDLRRNNSCEGSVAMVAHSLRGSSANILMAQSCSFGELCQALLRTTPTADNLSPQAVCASVHACQVPCYNSPATHQRVGATTVTDMYRIHLYIRKFP